MKSVFVAWRNEYPRDKSGVYQNEGGTQPMAHCPECDAGITLQGLMIGEIIYCPDCNAELEVLNLEQPAVALAPEVEEDWGE